MSNSAGYPLVCGAVIEAALPGWGAAATITNRVPIINESLTEEVAFIEDQTLRGLAGHDALDAAEISVKGSLKTDIRYTLKSESYFCGSDLLLSAAMGGVPEINGSYVSTLFLAESPSRRVTIAINKQVSYWEFVSCMLNGFKITGKAGQALEAEFAVMAHRLLRTGTTNGATQFGNLAANGGKRVRFPDITFRLGDLSDALAAADAIGINEFTLDYQSGLGDPEFSTPDYNVTVGAGTHGDNATTHSPRLTLPVERNGRRKMELSFTLPRYYSNQMFTWRDAETELQCDIKSSIDSAARTFSILMPRLKIVEVKGETSGPERVPLQVKAQLLLNGGTSSGTNYNDYMTNSVATTNKIPEEFQIELLNSADGRTDAIWS